MQRFLAALAVPFLLAAANAQCFEQNVGVLCPLTGGQAGFGDDVLFDLQPMNITFPMGGLASTYTHAHICSNGVIFLTNGLASSGTTYAYQTTQFFVGDPGSDPRIAPYWIDLESVPANGGGVFYNNTIPGKFVVTWVNTVEWATQTPLMTIQAQLFANGDVQFYYSSSVTGITVGFGSQFVSRCGVSQGNGVLDPGSMDLSTGAGVNLSNFCVYEEFPVNVFDLQDTSVTFVNAGTGYVDVAAPCNPAFHEPYGSGCYNVSDSFYQYLPDASTAPSFNGQSMLMSLVGGEYFVTWGGASYVVPPISAAALALSDDSEVSQALSSPIPSPIGPVSQLYVGANGVVSFGPNSASASYVPDAGTDLNAPVMAFYSHHDFNPTETGSGQVKYHEAVVGSETIAYITWDGVENYPTGVLNPSTLQFQFNLSNGNVALVWQSMDSDTTSSFGSGHLIGWSPGGASLNDGSITLSTALPLLTSTSNTAALALSASPAPVSTATAGSVVTYTTSNLRDYTIGGGVAVGLNILSVTQVPGGVDLSFLGAPGCSAYVGSIDFSQAMVGVGSTNSVNLAIPAGVPSGLSIYSQSINLIPAHSLPNGQNALGMILSNGVKTYISSF